MQFKAFINESKVISCAMVLTDGEVFLAVHPTYSNYWEIPKGIHEGGSFISTVVREFEEEVGIDLSKYKSDIRYMGKYRYLSHKDLQVFVLKLEKLPQTNLMRCSSTFNYKGRRTPEVSDYKYLNFDDIFDFKPQMQRIIFDIAGKI